MQKTYLMTLYELAEKDKNVLLLLADSGTSYDSLFKQALPGQVYDFGIAEENMVSASAGLASCGKIPFVFTASAFLSYRSFEFIRDDVCFQNSNVKFIGVGEGVSWSTLGATHHTTEELALLRVLPNLVVLSPSSPSQVSECVKFAYRHKGPVYIRIGMGGEKELYSATPDIFTPQTIVEGDDLTIYSTAGLTAEVVACAEELKKQGINAKVVDICAIKPFDKNVLKTELMAGRPIVTVEEHSVIGGIGDMIAEIIATQSVGVKFKKIGLYDTFAKGYGTLNQVREQNGLGAEGLANQIKEFLGK